MGFRPNIAPDIQPMPQFCFADGKIGLGEMWQKKLNQQKEKR
jgi:hypothetical protein